MPTQVAERTFFEPTRFLPVLAEKLGGNIPYRTLCQSNFREGRVHCALHAVLESGGNYPLKAVYSKASLW